MYEFSESSYRGSGRINTLAVVNSSTTNRSTLSRVVMLTSSVLVTGALLVGTGDCTVVGNIISVNASIQTSINGKLCSWQVVV